jgi:uncharacterized protein (TIGR03067 family)
MRTRILLLAVPLAVGFAPAPYPNRDRRKRIDLRSLQGTWAVIKGDVDGVNYFCTYRPTGLSASLLDRDVQIAGNRLTFPAKAGSSVVTTWTIRQVGGNAIDLESADGRLRLFGLYRLDGATLSLCVSDQGFPRPTRLVGGRCQNLVILKRK